MGAALALGFLFSSGAIAFGQSEDETTARPVPQYEKHESERSDKLTGGKIEKAELEAGQPDIRVTLNVPSFRLTLWQNGKEVKTYSVGVGRKEYPIYIGDREATQVIWNPSWIPPNSDWVRESKGDKPGEVIKASDPRNPIGKVKIPLGDAYLIHQAKGAGDLGNLVSHGCVRMMLPDLYDLANKIVVAQDVPVSHKRIESAKRSSKQLVANLPEKMPVDINYDTLVVEGGVLHIYPDVYDRGTNTTERLRAELESSGVNISNLDARTMRQMIARVKRGTQFVVEVSSIEAGRALEDGRTLPVVGRAPAKKPATRKRTVRR
jgi:hypothetical protein